MPNQPAGRPFKYGPFYEFCPKCMGITKHRYHLTSDSLRCMEFDHSKRARIVNLLKHKVLANPLHPCYDESNNPS